MQCPECSYVSFKKEKACAVCGFKFKKIESTPSLGKKESFSIFAAPPHKEEQKIQKEKENIISSVGVFETLESESFIDSETGDFKLDLPEIEEEELQEVQLSSDSIKEISEYEPLELDRNSGLYFGEMEVEGLGLETIQTTEGEKPDETQSEETEHFFIKDPKNLDETPSLERVLEVPELEEDLRTPELDLGDKEVKLDQSYEPSSPNEPDNATNPSDVLPNLNLETKDLNDPLNIQNNDIIDIEIQNQDLKLESPNGPENDKA